MQNDLLPVEECCAHYNIEYGFIELLHEHNLIEIVTVDEHRFLPTDALRHLESIMRMHFDLDINLEGIEVINNLLSRVNRLHQQIMLLENKVKVYENEM